MSMINTDLEVVTFKVEFELKHNRHNACVRDEEGKILGRGWSRDTKLGALVSLYADMAQYHYHSFRLVVEDNGQIVQELCYRERH